MFMVVCLMPNLSRYKPSYYSNEGEDSVSSHLIKFKTVIHLRALPSKLIRLAPVSN